MKTILVVGGVAHGRKVVDLGADKLLLGTIPPTEHIEFGIKIQIKDGYHRVKFVHGGWPAEVMLEDTLRDEDIEILTKNLEIEALYE